MKNVEKSCGMVLVKATVVAAVMMILLFILKIPALGADVDDPCAMRGIGGVNQAENNRYCGSVHHSAPQNCDIAENNVGNITTLTKNQAEDDDDKLPEEYGDFLNSLPSHVADRLPDKVFSESRGEVGEAAMEAGDAIYLLSGLFNAVGSSLTSLIPVFSMLCGAVIMSALCHTFASGLGQGMSGAVSFAAKLCSFGIIASAAMSSLSSLKEYFDGLFGAVAAFVPLSAVTYAMGGNLTSAAESSFSLSVTLSVCQFFCSETVIPMFCICLSMTLITVFEGTGGAVGRSAASTLKKWYTTALGFVMMILTASTLGQSIIAVKADSAALKGAKFAVSSFIPISGGTVASTLATLSASAELLRGALGVIGMSVVLLLLIPVIAELALIRLMIDVAAFLAGVLGCGGEQALLSEVGSLYGYLEGVAAMSAAVFIISFAVFAVTSGAAG